jgi:hypothetical protein
VRFQLFMITGSSGIKRISTAMLYVRTIPVHP